MSLKLKEKLLRKKSIQSVKIRNITFIPMKRIFLFSRWTRKTVNFPNLLNSKDTKKLFWQSTLKELKWFLVLKITKLYFGI